MDPLVIFILIYVILALTMLWNPSLFHNVNLPKGNLLVVIAHPDDESMFFGPLISSFTNSINKLYILCLSNGDENGLGLTRQEEFEKAVKVFKAIPIQIKSKYLLDGPKEKWDTDLIHNLITDAVKIYRIHTVVSFDSYGVSGHPNHISTYRGSKYVEGVNICHLVSTTIWRKYLSILDLPYSWIESWFKTNNHLLVVSSFEDYFLTRSALKKHKSQMIWFRKLYSIFSRYMFVNTFQVKLVDN